MASANALGSDMGVNRPHFPFSSTSAEPAQFVATTGVPSASASMRTVGSPSKMEDETKAAERAINA